MAKTYFNSYITEYPTFTDSKFKKNIDDSNLMLTLQYLGHCYDSIQFYKKQNNNEQITFYKEAIKYCDDRINRLRIEIEQGINI